MDEGKWNVYPFSWDKPEIKRRRAASNVSMEEAVKIAYSIANKRKGRGAYISDKIYGDEENLIW